MVFRGMEVAKVLAVCEELRRAFSQGHFRIGAQRLRVTVSVGVAPLTEYRNQSVSLKKQMTRYGKQSRPVATVSCLS